MARIQLKNVQKRWTNFVAVENFNLDIADQEFLVLLGSYLSLPGFAVAASHARCSGAKRERSLWTEGKCE